MNQLGQNQINESDLSLDEIKSPTLVLDQKKQELANIRDQLKALGYKRRTPEENSAYKQQREAKLAEQIAIVEQGLGRKLSEADVDAMKYRLDVEMKKDAEDYTARFQNLFDREKELVRDIESARPDLERAEEYWQNALKDEKLITKPMNPNCEISIVVPAYDEDPERITRQIESLKKQKGISTQNFEIIYVVNNGILDSSSKSQGVAEKNQRLIEFLRQNHGLNIHVIDKSTAGNEIPECNVGKARNRGVAEASLRFKQNNRNGILIQTDADTWFEDEDFLAKVKSRMEVDENLLGIAGGLKMIWNPDTKDPKEREILRKKIDRLFMKKTAVRFGEIIRNPQVLKKYDISFMGADMITRSFESAVVGGIPKTNVGEDGLFGEALIGYAKRKNKQVVSSKHELFATTAVRESDRTGSSFKKVFDSIDLDKPEMVTNEFVKNNPNEPREVELNQVYINRLKDAIRHLDGGNAYIEDFEKSLSYVQIE